MQTDDQKKIERWEQYRDEMNRCEKEMVKIALSFIELGAYSNASELLGRAAAADFMRGRMPKLFMERES